MPSIETPSPQTHQFPASTSPLTTNSTVSTWDDLHDTHHKMKQHLRHLRYEDEDVAGNVSREELNERVGRIGILQKFGSSVNGLVAANQEGLDAESRRNRRVGSMRQDGFGGVLQDTRQQYLSPAFSDNYDDEMSFGADFADDWDMEDRQMSPQRGKFSHFSPETFSPVDAEFAEMLSARSNQEGNRNSAPMDLRSARSSNRNPPRLSLRNLPTQQHSAKTFSPRPAPEQFHALNSNIEDYIIRYVADRYYTKFQFSTVSGEDEHDPVLNGAEHDVISRISSMHGSTMTDLIGQNHNAAPRPTSQEPPITSSNSQQDLDNISLTLSPRGGATSNTPPEERLAFLRFNANYPSPNAKVNPANLSFYHTLREQVHASKHNTTEPSKEDLILYSHHLMGQVQFLQERLRNQEEICNQYEKSGRKKKGKKSQQRKRSSSALGGRPGSRLSNSLRSTPGGRPGSANTTSRFTFAGVAAAATMPEKLRALQMQRIMEIQQKRKSAVMRANQLQRYSAKFLRKKAGKSYIDVYVYVEQKVHAMCRGWITRRRLRREKSAAILIQYHWRRYLRRKQREAVKSKERRFSDNDF